MPRNDGIEVEGAVMEVLSNTTYRVELANGHRLVAFVGGRNRLRLAPFVPGQKVRLRLSPCDLSHGRVLAES